MNKNILGVLFFAFPFALLNAMEKEEEGKTELTFVAAQPGENLDKYRDILVSEYTKLVEPEKKEFLLDRLTNHTFPTIVSLIGNKCSIVKILCGNDPVGFFSFERLDDEATKIRLHVSPLLEKYRHNVCSQLVDCTKKEFPNACTIYTTCPSYMPKLQARIMSCGFTKDPNYECSKELQAPKDIPAYSLALK